MNDIIEVGEYCGTPLPKLGATNSEIDYLKKTFLIRQAKAFRITYDEDRNPIIENTSFAGIIELDSIRIHFSTKVQANLFYMLSFLKSEENFVFDPLKVIEIKEGGNFFDIIGRLFFNELERIIQHGMLKKYIKREENVNYLKGKILFSEQIKQNLLIKPKFYCRYHDLTCDNVENQIILRATNLLIPMIKYNEDLKYDLLRLEQILKEEVSLNVGLSARDCELVTYSRLNQHYKPIIDFSQLIFEEHFIRSVYKGKSKGFNFIVNMWQVYEDFITEMIKEVVETHFRDYIVVPQMRFNTLVKEKTIFTKPDIILQNKITNEYELIIDAKYKTEEKESDFYQMIAYSLAIPLCKKCCLIYPESKKITGSKYTVVKDLLNEKSPTIELHTRSISLFGEEKEDFKSFIDRIKNTQIKPILEELVVRRPIIISGCG